MNFKKFGAFILAFGLVVTFIGAMVAMDSPPKRQLTEPEGWQRDLERAYTSNPFEAAERRQNGAAIAIPGIVVAVIGLVIMLSAKAATPSQPATTAVASADLPRPTGQAAENLTFCITCGETLPSAAAYCPKCGARRDA